MNCDTCKTKEADQVTEVAKTSRIMSDMVETYDRQNKRLWTAVIALITCLALMGGCMVWVVTNAQRLTNEAVLNALQSIAEIGVVHESSTTTITQDTGEGQGNNVYQSGEYATYEEAEK